MSDHRHEPRLRRAARGLWLFGRALPEAPEPDPRPDHVQCDPAWIKRALRHASEQPAGGWYALDAASAITAAPRAYTVRGRALVAWRDAHGLIVAPEACPHLGASLAGACARDGALICPWHGLALGRDGHRGWRPLRAHDDGVLAWVQLPDEPALTAAPRLPARPSRPLAAVVRVEALCEPRDVIANRLDPWHGAHFHPYAFRRLRVIEQDERSITVRVAYRVLGPLAVEVDARFDCPSERCIAMTIVRGEGEGSVVETHATPLGEGRTAVVEATSACSERRGFQLARALAPILRPLMTRAARQLWLDDAAYAERLYALRARGSMVALDRGRGGARLRRQEELARLGAQAREHGAQEVPALGARDLARAQRDQQRQ